MKISELYYFLKADLARLSPSEGRGSRCRKVFSIFSPRFVPVILIRWARFCRTHSILSHLSLLFTWANFFLFGIECASQCEIGPGLFLPHTSGTVIGAAKIGANATIFQGVTFGAVKADLGFDPILRPVLGNGVIVGAGAKILGGITIGDFSKVGANAVVLESVPANSLAVGVPAKIHSGNIDA